MEVLTGIVVALDLLASWFSSRLLSLPLFVKSVDCHGG
jgi:hypothetical protein